MSATSIGIANIQGSNGNLFAPLAGSTKDKRAKLKDMARLLWAIAMGTLIPGASRPRVVMGTTAASGTVTLNTASGDVGAAINGVSIEVTFAVSDANTADLLAAAINASEDALVADVVTATSAAGVVTISSVWAGKPGNTVTLAATGTGATASGTRLTGGAGFAASF